MLSEHFTKEEIVRKVKEADETNAHQMNKLVKRLKIAKTDRQLSRCWDHWVFWIKVKRQMKHVLNYCNASTQPVKCDISWAFNKWKRGNFVAAQALNR